MKFLHPNTIKRRMMESSARSLANLQAYAKRERQEDKVIKELINRCDHKWQMLSNPAGEKSEYYCEVCGSYK